VTSETLYNFEMCILGCGHVMFCEMQQTTAIKIKILGVEHAWLKGYWD